MMREKQLEERKHRPQVDTKAAGRFIKHGLFDRNDKKRPMPGSSIDSSQHPKNKKIRFPENDSD